MDIHGTQQFAYRFCTHDSAEFIAVFFHFCQVIIFGQQLTTGQWRHARIDNDECFEVQHALDIAQRNIQHHAETAWQRFQEPDVRNRRSQFDVRHTLATYLGQGHFNATFFADHTAMLQAFVLAAQAFIVLGWTEDLGAEQTVALRFECSVVNGFRFLDLTIGPRTDFLRRCQRNLDRVEFFFLRNLLE